MPVPPEEIEWKAVRASGPGGQNVNKVSTAVELRFDVGASRSLSAPVKARLRRLAGSRMTSAGVLVLFAQRFRSQELNRADAVERLEELVTAAEVTPKSRRATKATFGSKLRRLETKTRRSDVKSRRRPPGADHE